MAQRVAFWRTVHYPGYHDGGYYYLPQSISTPEYEHYDETAHLVADYRQQAQLALALKEKVDAETELLVSYTQLAIQRARLMQVASALEPEERQLLAPPANNEMILLTHSPVKPMARIR